MLKKLTQNKQYKRGYGDARDYYCFFFISWRFQGYLSLQYRVKELQTMITPFCSTFLCLGHGQSHIYDFCVLELKEVLSWISCQKTVPDVLLLSRNPNRARGDIVSMVWVSSALRNCRLRHRAGAVRDVEKRWPWIVPSRKTQLERGNTWHFLLCFVVIYVWIIKEA